MGVLKPPPSFELALPLAIRLSSSIHTQLLEERAVEVSHDHLNEQKEVQVEDELRDRWAREFVNMKEERERKGEEKIVWGLVDGFLLYWHKGVIDQLDVRITLRVPHDVLKQPRHEQHGYHTAVQSDPEGALWRNSPGYWDDIVYPAYVDAFKDLQMSMGEAVKRCCEEVKRAVEGLD